MSSPAEGDIVDYQRMGDSATARALGERLVDQLVVIRLNGGLGTSMELARAKSLIHVREQRSFLQLIAEQACWLRERFNARVPLLLMNSFATRADSLAQLAAFEQPDGLPLDFLQHKVPRIDELSGGIACQISPDERWAPPGHGDIYLALWLSGLLDNLIARGYRWAFVSNADNLGAIVDPAILGFLEREARDFALEVTPKTRADRKGGTLVRHAGRLTLLERAQVGPKHLDEFEDIHHFQVFNTNNLWFRLEALAQRMAEGSLHLPMIVNPKQVEGRTVAQLETAMGAAIGTFDRAAGILVGRERFAPVKTTNDLLAVRSDAYMLGNALSLRLSPERDPAWGPPDIRLDRRYFRGIEAFEHRIPHPPSLVACRRLEIIGDVSLGPGVVLRGEVTLRNEGDSPRRLEGGTVLDQRDVTWH